MTTPTVCPHCWTRCRTTRALDQHLRFDCPALGRRNWADTAAEADDIAAAEADFHHQLASR